MEKIQIGKQIPKVSKKVRPATLISEHYGPSTSRYSAKRITVTVAPGDKHVGNNLSE
jgi:hypothetical protein